MRVVALLLAIVIGCAQPAPADPKPFIAVYSSPDLAWMWEDFEHLKPDLLHKSINFSDFDDFLDKAIALSGNRPLVIDLSFHGNEEGLYLQRGFIINKVDIGIDDRASFSYIIKHLEAKYKIKQFTVLTEACQSGRSYKYTSKTSFKFSPFDNVEAYYKVPSFPIYGVGSKSNNWGLNVYLQYKYGFRRWWEDLRVYETKPLDEYEGDLDKSKTLQDMKLNWELYSGDKN